MHGLKRRGLETEHQPPRQSPTLLSEVTTRTKGGSAVSPTPPPARPLHPSSTGRNRFCNAGISGEAAPLLNVQPADGAKQHDQE